MSLNSSLLSLVQPWALLGTAVGLLIYVAGWIIYATTFHPLSQIPGPLLARVSRIWLWHRVYVGDAEIVQRALHAKYGPLVRIAHDQISCSDPEAIPKIYSTQSPLVKSDFYPPWAKRVLSKYPDNFSMTDEKLHAERRRIVAHVYTMSNVMQSEEYVDKCSQLLVDRLTSYAFRGTTVDLGEWCQWYAFDAIGELFFGKMFGFMENEADHESWIATLEALIPVLCLVAVAPWYSRGLIFLLSVLNPMVRRGLRCMDRITDAARECVGKRVDDEGRVVEEAERRDMLQQLLEIVSTKGEKVDFKIGEVQLEAWGALIAGSDTTAIAMRAVFYYVLKSPQVYRELQLEIDAATRAGALSYPPRYSEALKLPLLCATIKEAMRLHPSVALTLPRVVPLGGMMLSDHFIPAGYQVGMNAAVVGFSRNVFGYDADSFRPSRWLADDAKGMEKALLGFGAGTRTCLGKNISLLQIHKLIPCVMQNFNLELEDPTASWVTDNKFFNRQSGWKVRLARR